MRMEANFIHSKLVQTHQILYSCLQKQVLVFTFYLMFRLDLNLVHMPVEHLWQWLREDMTYHACYTSTAALKQQVEQFQQQINANPLALADRLWVKSHLDPEEEKLRVST